MKGTAIYPDQYFMKGTAIYSNELMYPNNRDLITLFKILCLVKPI